MTRLISSPLHVAAIVLVTAATTVARAQDVTGPNNDAPLFGSAALAGQGTQARPKESAAAPQGEAKSSVFPRLGIHLASLHWPPRDKYGKRWNDVNPGVYFRWSNGITVGGYRNSESRDSFYAGWTWARSACGPALTLGVITGYAKGTMPMAIPSLCVFDHYRLTFLPKFDPKAASVLHLSVEF